MFIWSNEKRKKKEKERKTANLFICNKYTMYNDDDNDD